MTQGPLALDPDTLEGSDEALFARVQKGETALFAVLVRRNNPRLFRMVRGLLRNDAEAEDAVQQAYLSAFKSADSFRGEARFSTWLTRIALRAALARLSKKSPLSLAPLPNAESGAEVPSMSPTPEENTAARELAKVLESAIDALPDALRVVFVLRELEGLSSAEAAQSLDISEEAVRVRLHRARAWLRARIDEQLGEAASQVYHFAGERCDRIVANVMAALRSREFC